MDVVRISDGLGNQMFQYAFARKISILTGKMVYLDTRFINNEDEQQMENNFYFRKKMGYRQYGLDHFRIILQSADEKLLSHWSYLQRSDSKQKAMYDFSIINRLIWQYKNEELNFNGEILRSGIKFPMYYQGYFFDLKYFDDIKSVLQREFSLKKKMKLSRMLQEIIKNRNTVSLHVRRGDFLRLNRDISNSEYYAKAIRLIENEVEDPIYMIFSDDIGWVEKNMDIPREKVYVSNMCFADYEELTIMKYCKNNIIANSTFSYWAAYLNSNADKIVICPKRWKTAIIPSDWIMV